MNVLFVAPESQAYYREFVRGLKELGARVVGVGSKPPQALSPQALAPPQQTCGQHDGHDCRRINRFPH